MMDYGNARIAALRGRLLDPATLRRLAELGSAEAFLATLERSDDWRTALRQATPLFSDAPAAIEATIERRRNARLSALVRWYEGPVADLVAALVLGLDLERVVAIVRRRRGGASADTIGHSIIGGALLDQATLGDIARVGSPPAIARRLVRAGVLSPGSARHVTTLTGDDDGSRLEGRLVAAFDAERLARASGRGAAASRVRAIVEEERAERDVIAGELRDAGPSAAWLVERSSSLARLDRLAHAGPRDPLGIGAVAGYVAAVEAEAIRVRAALARVVAGWGPEAMAPFLAVAS